ncbi:ribosomal protein L22/L17, partial [Cladochytrium replicatum]
FRTAQIPTSIKKLILVAKLIRGLPVSRAVSELKMSKKRAAVRVLAAINRAHKSIQHNNNRYDITTSNLVIDQAWIGKGQTLKRINIHGRGRTGKMTRPFTHMKMVFKEVKEKPKHPLYPTPEERIKIKLEEDWEKIQDLARRHALYVQLPERRPLQKRYPVWSCKPWKYVSSKKWNDP